MGKPALPMNLKVLDGKKPHRSNEELNRRAEYENALKVARNKLKPPQWLTDDAKREFKYIVKETESIELLNNLDIFNLAIFCNQYSEYIRVSQRIIEDGPIVEANKASETVDAAHPLYVKQYQLVQQLRVLMSDLGLSPSARARLALKLVNVEVAAKQSDVYDI